MPSPSRPTAHGSLRRLGWNRADVDIRSGKELLAVPTGGQYVLAVAFSPDGRQFATGTNGQPIT